MVHLAVGSSVTAVWLLGGKQKGDFAFHLSVTWSVNDELTPVKYIPKCELTEIHRSLRSDGGFEALNRSDCFYSSVSV